MASFQHHLTSLFDAPIAWTPNVFGESSKGSLVVRFPGHMLRDTRVNEILFACLGLIPVLPVIIAQGIDMLFQCCCVCIGPQFTSLEVFQKVETRTMNEGAVPRTSRPTKLRVAPRAKGLGRSEVAAELCW